VGDVSTSISLHTFCIGADHASLAGHFPGNPIVPGVVILDAVLAAARRRAGADWQLQRLPHIKFLQPLMPDQAVTIELTADVTLAAPQRMRFRVMRGTELLSSGELLLAPAGAGA